MSAHDLGPEIGKGDAASELTPLEIVAARVSDGDEVDWEGQSDSLRSDEDRAMLSRLRIVAGIAEFHRESQRLSLSRSENHGAIAAETERDAPRVDTGESSRNGEPSRDADAASLGTWGSLDLRERLGRGGFGDVYRAYDRTLHRDVALKLLRPQRRSDTAGRAADLEAVARNAAFSSNRTEEALLREGRLLARLRHPNIVTIYGADRHDDRVGLWMELLHGSTLAEIVHEHGPLGPEEAVVVGMAVCGALAAIHQTGLVHRDVKAQNVMREARGRIVLMDLGLGTDPAQKPLDLAGTPLYMTPELLAGKAATPATDLYALGVMLYYLVTSEFPIEAGDLPSLRKAHSDGKRRPLRDVRPDLPREFVEVVERAIATNPDARFRTAGEMEQALMSATDRASRTPGHDLRNSEVLPSLRSDRTNQQRGPDFYHRKRTPRAGLGSSTALSPRGFSLTELSRTPRGRRFLIALCVVCGVVIATSIAALRGRYEVAASIFRIDGAGTREQLDTGDAVALGDFLGLELRGSRDLYTYVVSADDRGEAYLLFPLPGFSPQNPLRHGDRHLLPGQFNEQTLYWQVSSAGGRERFLIVTSPDRLHELEDSLEQLSTPSEPAMAARLTEPAKARLRGIGWMGSPAETARPVTARENEAVREIRQLVDGSERARGLWVREVVLMSR